MFSRISRRLTYANVVATLALIFAMSGGAVAASKFLITSTKQIKPSVIKELQGKAGAKGSVGPAGPAGPSGPAGPLGPAGAKGENGAPGTPGSSGKDGESVVSASLNPDEEGCAEGGSKFTVGGKTTTACNGEKGEPGPPGPPGTTGFTKTLPKGQTETGSWTVSNPSTPEEYFWTVPVSFAIPIKAAIAEEQDMNVVRNCTDLTGESLTECEGQTKEAERFCPGTVQIPRADEGHFCFYQGAPTQLSQGSVTVTAIFQAGAHGGAGVGAAGAEVGIKYEGPAGVFVAAGGTWAVNPSS